jgi:hypothetical protein
LLEWLLDEQERRWRQGERPRVEDFLDRQPELRRRPEAVLDLIAQEVGLRQRAGGRPVPMAGDYLTLPAVRKPSRCPSLLAPSQCSGSRTAGAQAPSASGFPERNALDRP